MSMEFRDAEISDSLAIASIKVATWRSTYKGLFPSKVLEDLNVDEINERWKKILAQHKEDEDKKAVVCEIKGKVVGYATGLELQGDQEKKYDIDLMAIYVLKDFHGMGIGRKLVELIVNYFVKRGLKSMVIWVLKDNPAVKFYAVLGGTKLYEAWGETFTEIGYVWDDISKIYQ